MDLQRFTARAGYAFLHLWKGSTIEPWSFICGSDESQNCSPIFWIGSLHKYSSVFWFARNLALNCYIFHWAVLNSHRKSQILRVHPLANKMWSPDFWISLMLMIGTCLTIFSWIVERCRILVDYKSCLNDGFFLILSWSTPTKRKEEKLWSLQ